MKWVIRKIVSAWAIASIVLFGAVVSFVEPVSGHDKDDYCFLVVLTFVAAVTGAGWLWHEFGGGDERD